MHFVHLSKLCPYLLPKVSLGHPLDLSVSVLVALYILGNMDLGRRPVKGKEFQCPRYPECCLERRL